MSILLNFTKAISSGISLLENEIKDVLPNLYLVNREEDNDLDLIFSLDYPSYYPHAYGQYLDRLGFQFGVERQVNEEDGPFRRRILYSITRNVTITGLKNSIKTLFEVDNILVNIDIIETYKNTFDGVSTSLDSPIRTYKGTQLYGLSITISPINLKANTIHVENPTGYESVLDNEGNPVITSSGLYVVYIKDGSGNIVTFDKYINPYYRAYLSSFAVTSMREIAYELVAAGVKIEKVVVKQPGAGGTKGEIYVN